MYTHAALPTQVAAFAITPSSTSATIINAHTGQVQGTLTTPVATADLLPLPRAVHDGTGGADQHVYVLVPAGTGAKVALLPNTPATSAAFEAERPGFSFWRLDQQQGAVRGLGFTGGCNVGGRLGSCAAGCWAAGCMLRSHKWGRL